MQNHPRDILIELVKNAIEAMPQGGVVRLQAWSSDQQVHIQVTDSGVGIPPDELPNVFGFLVSTRGGGFGLWSADQMATLNGGKINVASTLGKGSVFTLILPRADQKLEAQYA
jgi:signal transduction histidine kinase